MLSRSTATRRVKRCAPALSAKLEIALKNGLTPPVELSRILSPGSLSPITKIARLKKEVVQQGIAVAKLSRDAFGPRQRIDLLVEQRAQSMHRTQNILVSPNPAAVIRPGGTLHVEVRVRLLRR